MTPFFEKALPVWESGRTCEKNNTLLFRAVIEKSRNVTLRVTGASLYQIFVNGEFIAAGPARAAHGYYRIDEIELSDYLREKQNIVVLQTAGYYINTFYTLEQPAFLCAEIIDGGKCVAATGDAGFEVRAMPERIQKVQRYSYQRAFVEVYNWDEELEEFKTNVFAKFTPVALEAQQPKTYMRRGVYYPAYEAELIQGVVECGKVQFQKKVREYQDRSYLNINDSLHGYEPKELEICVSEELCRHVYIPSALNKSMTDTTIEDGSYITFQFEKNLSGVVEFVVECRLETTLYMTFDEIQTGDDYGFRWIDVLNAVVWKLKPGTYHLLTFEPYVMKYVRFASVGGSVQIRNLKMRRYGYPEISRTLHTDSVKLRKVFDAAVETFRQNTFDIFMDCPSRERAGWLCDSFFMGRTEYALTGSNQVEHNFLENYALCSNGTVPEGMLPMCYPADFEKKPEYIPQWGMWFVLELADYYARSQDDELIKLAKPRVDKLAAYFKRYENEYGFLENLDGANMIEWSESRKYMKNVNFPTNMLYARMLECIGMLYEDVAALEKAGHLKKLVFRFSYRNGFFIDNAVRDADGTLKITENVSECGQYFAFFTGVADMEHCENLWRVLVKDFGYERRSHNKWEHVVFANAFVGNYLRMELLYRYGEIDRLLHDIGQYFYYMAERTGTLWEFEDIHASCNHGFASYIAYLLNQIDMLT